ncbi:YtxH domain-containing protein, partial [Enterococcus faecium]
LQTVNSDTSFIKRERKSNSLQEISLKTPENSTAPTDRASQRSITKERQSTVQRVPLQNTKRRPPIKTATINKGSKKPS